MRSETDSESGGEREPEVALTLDASPENAAVARRAVAHAAARHGFGDRLAGDAKVVVTEGFTNATQHAYPQPFHGSVEVRALADEGGMTIVIRDSGEGFRPGIPEHGRTSGFGLGLIAALSERVELLRLDRGGIEVRARLEQSADHDSRPG